MLEHLALDGSGNKHDANGGNPGRTGIIIAASPGTAETPRAHITNMAGLGE